MYGSWLSRTVTAAAYSAWSKCWRPCCKAVCTASVVVRTLSPLSALGGAGDEGGPALTTAPAHTNANRPSKAMDASLRRDQRNDELTGGPPVPNEWTV